MQFIESKSMKISVLPEQAKQLSSKEHMAAAFLNPDVLSFDIQHENTLIGFVMVRKFDEGAYFLWNYAIDYKFQNQGFGTKALAEFISFMSERYHMSVMTTTYIYGNESAKKLYEKIGFVETDIVNSSECHEVNMINYL